MKPFGRLMTAMVTPFDNDLNVDYETAQRLAVKLVEDGSDGLVVCGTTGESPTLSGEEKFNLMKCVKQAVGDSAIVVGGTGSYSTKESAEMTALAEKSGIDAVMVVAPYYNKPPQEGLYRHFKMVAEHTSLPIIMYNIPGRTQVNVLPETVLRLSEINNIVAIKEASGLLDQISQLRSMLPDDFLIYSGDDSLTLPMMSIGCHGVISVASHIAGRKLKQMIELFAAGKVLEAESVHRELMPLFKAMFVTTNPIPVKAALALAGFPVGGLRLPLVEAGEKEKILISEVIQGL